MKIIITILLTINLLIATDYKVLDSNNLEVKNYTIDIKKLGDTIESKMYDEENGILKINTTDLNGSTLSFVWKADGIDIIGTIEEDKLHYKGVFNSQKVDKIIALGDAPFIFNARDSLTPFVLSDRDSMYLYVTSSSSLDAYKFKATKENEVKLKINGVEYNSIEIDFSIAGFIGLFMSSDKLYFDKKTGLFLKRIDNRRERVELIDNE